MIVHKCPYCEKSYTWDGDFDSYGGTDDIDFKVSEDISLTLYTCAVCAATVAVFVNDNNGGSLYVPSTDEL